MIKCVNLLGMRECTLQYRKVSRQVEVRSFTSNTMTLKTWRDCWRYSRLKIRRSRGDAFLAVTLLEYWSGIKLLLCTLHYFYASCISCCNSKKMITFTEVIIKLKLGFRFSDHPVYLDDSVFFQWCKWDFFCQDQDQYFIYFPDQEQEFCTKWFNMTRLNKMRYKKGKQSVKVCVWS